MKTVYFGEGDSAGINITFTKSRQTLSISGWFDHCVGIEGERLALLDFFKRVGITKKDCDKAFKGDE